MSVLELAEALSQKTQDVERTVHLMEALQNIIVKTLPANSLRELVLRSLYTHIDCEDERVLVAIAKAMLTVSQLIHCSSASGYYSYIFLNQYPTRVFILISPRRFKIFRW